MYISRTHCAVLQASLLIFQGLKLLHLHCKRLASKMGSTTRNTLLLVLLPWCALVRVAGAEPNYVETGECEVSALASMRYSPNFCNHKIAERASLQLFLFCTTGVCKQWWGAVHKSECFSRPHLYIKYV